MEDTGEGGVRVRMITEYGVKVKKKKMAAVADIQSEILPESTKMIFSYVAIYGVIWSRAVYKLIH